MLTRSAEDLKGKSEIFLRKYVIGIDEVGRGPLAGPVAVGAFWCEKKLLKNRFRGVKDSKRLSPAEREKWYEKILAARRSGAADFSVTFVFAETIDRIGISAALRRAIAGCLIKLKVKPSRSHILLDGGIKAPVKFSEQETIIKGDEKEPVIALASIVAKVTRDRLMARLSRKYPDYGFAEHKGYGTRKHCLAIKKFGLCEIHRRSFLKRFTRLPS